MQRKYTYHQTFNEKERYLTPEEEYRPQVNDKNKIKDISNLPTNTSKQSREQKLDEMMLEARNKHSSRIKDENLAKE